MSAASAARIAVDALGFAVVMLVWLATLAVTVAAGIVVGLGVTLAPIVRRPDLVLAAVALALAWRLLVVSLGGA